MTPEARAWADLVDALSAAGRLLDDPALPEDERADGYRALLRGLHHQLARFEVDRERPELVPFNGWRQKFFMDNPDTRYWVADVRGDRRYRVTGHSGDAVYTSITAYTGSAGGTAAAARIDGDRLTTDPSGAFSVLVGGTEPGTGPWLPLPEGNGQLWVRHFHDDVADDRPGRCTIEPLTPPEPPPPIEAARFQHQVRRLATTIEMMPVAFSAVEEQVEPNTVHHWAEMADGAAYTEPGIHYQRGAWRLGPDEALVIEGETVPCRHWNALLYSRYLNSLDYRHRTVSRTGATATLRDGRYRLVLAARPPEGPFDGDWLDTEGRPSGLIVLRWLHTEEAPPLPRVRVHPIDESGGGA
ncbi:DUF1214 domain-containing protein [Actinomadura livida]|uniref:DUF1214 domain-containing protein n=1 Tax=Actinomadura livida TaxID=79909 RepID=A0A7W7IFD8_9ACTN|nr:MULTISPECIES: DUF1214 domain-containing protein [Actinomadura]MBB4775975.1 hypothetical protein [Actinomadura catellatispora]GGU16394.1 hypothetical protein GCM10010208_46910 [Actinomadura livida]